MPLFERYLIVDWSAANTPKTGRDSIWVCLCGDGIETEILNISTREMAMQYVSNACQDALDNHQKILAGFDFGFGYPKGASKRISGMDNWSSVWEFLESNIVDNTKNQSNRFEIASEINSNSFPDLDGPFWGHPHQHAGRYRCLKATRPKYTSIPEKRLVEEYVKSAQSVWKLAYTGSVGSQTLLGIARLQNLREIFEGHVAIWPFETRFAENFNTAITVAEVYPSIIPVNVNVGEIKDAAQVRTLAKWFYKLDQQDQIIELLKSPHSLSLQEVDIVLNEEGWIVGAGCDQSLLATSALEVLI